MTLPAEKKAEILNALQAVAYHPGWTKKLGIMLQDLSTALDKSYTVLAKSEGSTWDEGTYHVQTYNPREWLFDALVAGYTEEFRSHYIDGTDWGEDIVAAIHDELGEMCDCLGIVVVYEN